jgi:hypothetical protein
MHFKSSPVISEIQFSIFIPCTGVPSRLFSLRFWLKFGCVSYLSYSHISHPTLSPRCDNPNDIWRKIQRAKLLLIEQLAVLRNSSPLSRNIPLSISFWSTINLCAPLGLRIEFQIHTKEQVKLYLRRQTE